MEAGQEEYHKELSRTTDPIIQVFQRACVYQYEVLPHVGFLYKQSTFRVCVTFACIASSDLGVIFGCYALNVERTSARTHLCEILIGSRCHAIFLSNCIDFIISSSAIRAVSNVSLSNGKKLQRNRCMVVDTTTMKYLNMKPSITPLPLFG